MKIYQICRNFWATGLIFFLLLTGSICLAQVGRPPISLYYYESEGRILMCASGESGKQGVLFWLDENGDLHGMEPRRSNYQGEIMLEPAEHNLVAFQRILLGLGKLDPLLEDYVKPLQVTIDVLRQDGDWGDRTWQKLFEYIRNNTSKAETADLQLGNYRARVYRLDTIAKNRSNSKEKSRLQKLLQDSDEKKVKSRGFPMTLVKAYTDLINVSMPDVISAQDISANQLNLTDTTNIQTEKGGIWIWVVLLIIVSITFCVIGAFLERQFDLIARFRRGKKGREYGDSQLTEQINHLISVIGESKTAEQEIMQRGEALTNITPTVYLTEQIKDIKNRILAIRREVNKIQDKRTTLSDEEETILYQLKRIQDDVKDIHETRISTSSQTTNLQEEMRQQLDNLANALNTLQQEYKSVTEQLLEGQEVLKKGQKTLINRLRGVLRYIFKSKILIGVSSEMLSAYYEVLQSHLQLLHSQRLMQLAAPADEEQPNFNHIWFFTEYWKLNSSDRISELLEQFQESLSKIEPELEQFRENRCPHIIEFSDKNTLQDYLNSYQDARNLIKQFEPTFIPISEDKLSRLRETVILFIDRLDGNEIFAEDKIEAMLRLVSLRQLPIFEGYSLSHDKFHRVSGRESSAEYETGTILQVRKRGFMDSTTGKIVREAYVITAE